MDNKWPAAFRGLSSCCGLVDARVSFSFFCPFLPKGGRRGRESEAVRSIARLVSSAEFGLLRRSCDFLPPFFTVSGGFFRWFWLVCYIIYIYIYIYCLTWVLDEIRREKIQDNIKISKRKRKFNKTHGYFIFHIYFVQYSIAC